MIRRSIAQALTATLLLTGSAMAQPQVRTSWITTSDLTTLGAAAVGSAVLMGWDRQISTAIRESSLPTTRGLRGFMDVAGLAGDPGTVVVGAGLWVTGRFGGDRTRERLGLRSMEAIALAGLVTGGLKTIVGRARPDHSPQAPRSFVLSRGVGDRSEFQSFPSGHATAAFAFASAIDAELRRIAPKHPKWIVPLLYGMASATAVSRVYHDRHWASDVVMGSAIGFVGARAVVRWHQDQR